VDWLAYLGTLEVFVVVAVIGAGGYFLSRAVASWLHQRGAPPHEVRGVRIAVSLIAVALIAVVLFVAFGPLPVVSGVTVSAIIGLAATLALQTTIGNVISGFILLHNRMLRLNDTIQVSGVTGRVVQVGLITAWLRLEDGSVASVSNSNLLSGPLVNRSARERLSGEY
jgi:small-conductance mechanosensitive channel